MYDFIFKLLKHGHFLTNLRFCLLGVEFISLNVLQR
jgi:hypothetical protein